MEPEPQLTDEQWLLIADLFPDEPPSEKGGRDALSRECVEGILWVLRTRGTVERSAGAFSFSADLLASIQGLDRSWPVEGGLGTALAQAPSPRPHPLGRSNGRRHVFLGEKRGLCVGKTKRGKGTKIMVLADGRGLPLGAGVAPAPVLTK